jgi:hypothetical protein
MTKRISSGFGGTDFVFVFSCVGSGGGGCSAARKESRDETGKEYLEEKGFRVMIER